MPLCKLLHGSYNALSSRSPRQKGEESCCTVLKLVTDSKALVLFTSSVLYIQVDTVEFT